MPYELYLVHHGVDGQQWGVRNGPPYPLSRGRGVSKKKKKSPSILQKAVAKHKAKKAEKERNEKAAAAAKHAEDRQKAIDSGSASDILKFKGEITPDEMQNAINRIQKEQKLEELRKTESRSVEQRMDDVNKRAKNISTYMDTALSLYNNYDKITNIIDKKKKEPIEKAKKELIRSGDIDRILANRKALSTDELQEAYKRISTTEQLYLKQAGGKHNKPYGGGRHNKNKP